MIIGLRRGPKVCKRCRHAWHQPGHCALCRPEHTKVDNVISALLIAVFEPPCTAAPTLKKPRNLDPLWLWVGVWLAMIAAAVALVTVLG